MNSKTNKADKTLDQLMATQKWIVDHAKTLSELRDKEREFHGLHREFTYLYSEMLVQWEKSKHVKHPRDKGVIRENILGKFFEANSLLPKKYRLSSTSVRVCSAEGFLSSELDILFYMADENICLMGRNGGYEVYPAETAAGAIQVKSRLNDDELIDALKNIASIRRLRKIGAPHKPFGIIFAYDSDLNWVELAESIKKHSITYKRDELPNAIFILTKGYFTFGDDEKISVDTTALSSDRSKITLYGNPNTDHLLLFRLHSIVLYLLRQTPVLDVPIESYGSLPPTAGEFSYQFNLGNFGELANCKFHGPIALRFSEQSIRKIVEYCKTSQAVSFSSALAAAYKNSTLGNSNRNWGAQTVRIYNPDSLPLDQILVEQRVVQAEAGQLITLSLAFHMVSCEGMEILIPFCYDRSENLFEPCAECVKLAKKIANSKTPIRYLSPKGETWTGSGKKPNWVVEALADGKDMAEFQFKPDALS
ncbi:DUF6602 domain-containing protein [Variovorax atrisoli]|uniref:DUF6602 domain-containing protein n=1 Tax=Variovorax atrisoli TaxID=3394203 RepID=UPI00404038C9